MPRTSRYAVVVPGDPIATQRDHALIEAGMILASELSVDAVLQHIIDLAVEITDARYGALGVLTPDHRAIDEFLTVGITPEERAAIGDPPVGHGVLGVLIEEAGPIRIRDVTSDPRSVGFPPNHPHMRSFLGAPVVARGTVFGNIYLTEKRSAPEFTQDDEDALVVLASQAGIAVENARLYEEAQRAQRDLARLELMEERERIAKELHDGVIQSLFAVGMGLQGTAAATSDPDVARRLESAVDEIDRAIRDLRNYIFGLRPGILADQHLGHALQRLGDELHSKAGVLTIVDIDPELVAELAPRAGDIVPIVQEALSNVGRHADATTCRVSLARRDDETILEVDDDGAGFDAAAPRAGMGLGNIEARVRGLGGELTIESVRGEGTTLRATFPVHGPAATS
ncbi:MAG: GAF domain-containing sensor histidine kinase [Actinomycetota bacterium]